MSLPVADRRRLPPLNSVNGTTSSSPSAHNDHALIADEHNTAIHQDDTNAQEDHALSPSGLAPQPTTAPTHSHIRSNQVAPDAPSTRSHLDHHDDGDQFGIESQQIRTSSVFSGRPEERELRASASSAPADVAEQQDASDSTHSNSNNNRQQYNRQAQFEH